MEEISLSISEGGGFMLWSGPEGLRFHLFLSYLFKVYLFSHLFKVYFYLFKVSLNSLEFQNPACTWLL